MRTLSAALQAAVNAGNAPPDCLVELIDWAPHYAAVYTNGPQARGSAALASDGSLVQAYNDGAGTIYSRRIVDPTQPAWGAWAARTAAAAAAAGVCVAALSDRVRLLWQDRTTTNIYCADSFDHGQTWGAATLLFDAGGPCAGLAADGVATQVLVCYAAAANAYRVALWTLGGGWTKADWTNGDSYGAGGIGAQRHGDGSYRVAVALQAGASSGMAVQSSVYAGTWTPPAPLAPADLGAGLAVQDPHVAAYDGLYHCSYGVIDNGSVSGIVSARVALSHSADGVHWTDPLEDGNPFSGISGKSPSRVDDMIALRNTEPWCPPCFLAIHSLGRLALCRYLKCDGEAPIGSISVLLLAVAHVPLPLCPLPDAAAAVLFVEHHDSLLSARPARPRG